MNRPAATTLALLIAGLAGGGSGASRAAALRDPPDWHTVKCARYAKGWTKATTRLGTQGLGRDFLARHDAFLASGCTRPADVCPRSPEELRLANIMVILAMNAGTASTFPPFACR